MDHITRNFRFVAGFPVIALLSFFLVQNAFADANGRAGYSGASGRVCTSCHGAGAAVPSVTFTAGPTSVMAGSVSTFSVTVSGGPGMNAGIDVAANGGTLAVTMAGTKLSSGEVVHSAPTPFVAGSVTYSFSWTAPTTGGSYTLFATGLSDNGNGSDTGDGTAATSRTVTVAGGANVAPVARITAPASGTAGVPVNFSGATSTDADGTIAMYSWNFGDGTAGSGATTTHSFTAGTYTVALTVTDNTGATSSTTQSIVIASATTPPVLVANPGGPYSGAPGIAVQFSGAASTGSIASYVWNFGDGLTGSGVSPTHVYATAGTFQVTLTVTDTSGVVNASRTTVTIGAAAADPTVGEMLYEENCSGCHGDGGAGGSIFGESAEDIAEAFVEIADHADVAALLTEEDIAAIAEFLNAAAEPMPGEDLYNEYCAECHGEGGVGGPDGDVIGESAEDIWEAIDEEDEMNFLADVLSEEDVDAIAAYLNQCSEEEEEDEDDESFVASLLSAFDDDDDDDDEGGACVAGGGITALGDGSKANTKPPKSHAPAAKATAVSTGTFGGLELFALAGAGLMWGGRRRKK